MGGGGDGVVGVSKQGARRRVIYSIRGDGVEPITVTKTLLFLIPLLSTFLFLRKMITHVLRLL